MGWRGVGTDAACWAQQFGVLGVIIRCGEARRALMWRIWWGQEREVKSFVILLTPLQISYRFKHRFFHFFPITTIQTITAAAVVARTTATTTTWTKDSPTLLYSFHSSLTWWVLFVAKPHQPVCGSLPICFSASLSSSGKDGCIKWLARWSGKTRTV